MTKYWVGGTGNTNDPTNHWATTSGGAPGAGNAPTAADDIIFDAASGAGTVTIAAALACRSFQTAGSSIATCVHNGFTVTVGDGTAGAGNIALDLSGFTTYTAVTSTTSNWTFVSTSATVQTVNFNNFVTAHSSFSAAGSWQYVGGQLAASSSSILIHTSGTLDLNGQTVTRGLWQSVGAVARTLTLGAAAITITNTGANAFIASGSNLTITANTATMTFTNTSAGFNGGNFDYNGLSVVANAAQGFTLTSTGLTLGNFTRIGTAVRSDTLTLAGAGAVIVTGTFDVQGNSAINRLLIQSNVVGTAQTITAAATNFANVDFMDITGAGAGSWDVSTAILCPGLAGDVGGNTGITFCASEAQQWAGTSGGNWSANAWTTRVPLAHDDVTLATAFIAGQVVATDMARAGRDIDWTGVTGSPNWAYSQDTLVTGNLVFSPNQGTMLPAGFFWDYGGRGAQTITSNGKEWRAATPSSQTASVRVRAPGGSYTLTDAFSSRGVFQVDAGTFDTAGFDFECITFASTGSVTRAITFGGSVWTLRGSPTGSSITVWSSATAGLTFNDTPNIVMAETDARIESGAMRYDYTTNSDESAFYCARPATLTDDLDIILRISLDDWVDANSVFIAGVWNNTTESSVTSAQQQWNVAIAGSSGIIRLGTSTTGANSVNVVSTVGHGLASNAGTRWLRITRDKTTGDVNFYLDADTGSNTPPAVWTQLGATVVGATTSYFDSTSPLFFGAGLNTLSNTSAATIYYATVSDSIGGAPVATFDPSGEDDGTISFTDAQGNVWIAHQTGDRSTCRIAGGRAIFPGTAGNLLSTPTTAELETTGDLDIRVDLATFILDGSSRVFIGKSDGAVTNGWYLRSNSSTAINFGWRDSTAARSANATITGVMSVFTRGVLRVTLDVDDGAGGSDVRFYWAAAWDDPWTLFATVHNAFTTNVVTGSNDLKIGALTTTAQFFNGHIFRAQVRNNILDDGTGIVFDFDPSAVQDHSMAFREKSSNAAIVTVTQAGRTTKTWNQAGGTVPGTVTFSGGGGSSITFLTAFTANATTMFPNVVIPGGRTVYLTALNLFKVPSWTQVTTAGAGANAILSTTTSSASYLPLSGTTGPTVNYATIRDNRVSVLPPATFFEDFTLRADNVSNLGNLDTGETWVQTGGPWGYLGGSMYQSGATLGEAVFDCGLTDVDVRLIVLTRPSAGNLMVVARYVDASNFYFVSINSAGSMTLQKVVAGVSTSLGASGGLLLPGDEMGLRVYGTTIELLLNGNVQTVVTDSDLAVGTKVGVRGNNIVWRASSFRAGAPQFGHVTGVSLDAGNNYNWVFDQEVVFTDDFGMTDAIATAHDAVITDAEGLTDSTAIGMGVELGPDPMGMLDSLDLSTGFGIAISDDLGATDSMDASSGIVIDDNEGLTDSISAAPGVAIADTLGLTDSISAALNAIMADPIGLADQVAAAVGVVISDSEDLADTMTISTGFGVDFTDLVGLSDTLSLAIDMVITDTEGLSDQIATIFAVDLQDGLGFTDSLATMLGVGISDLLDLTDELLFEIITGIFSCLGLLLEVPGVDITFGVPAATIELGVPSVTITFEEC